MASKGKIKLGKYETVLKDNRINLKRFAYDVIRYTALKFNVPDNCIPKWEQKENVYGYDDFRLVVCRNIIRYQITNRYYYHTVFNERHKLKQLESFELIGRLLQEIIKIETEKNPIPLLEKVDISLAAVGELVLFLFSKDSDMYLIKLINYWFDCFMNIEKKGFETAGGLQELYLNGSRTTIDRIDQFQETFIGVHMSTYKKSINENLEKNYYLSASSRIKKTSDSPASKNSKEIEKLMFQNEVVMRQSKRKGFKLEFEVDFALVEPPERDEETGDKLPENPGLGMLEHRELYRADFPLAAAAPPSLNIPKARPEEQPQHRIATRSKKTRKASFRISLEQGLRLPDQETGDKLLENPGLGIPEHHEWYADDGALNAAPPPQNLPETGPEEKSRLKRLSAREIRMMRKHGSHKSVDQGLGKPSDASGTKQSLKKRATATTPSSNISTARPEIPAEQGFGQPSDSLGTKQSRRTRTTAATPSSNLSTASPEIPAEQGLGQPSDSLETKQSKRNKATSATPSSNLSTAKPEIPAAYIGGDSSLQTGLSSLCSGVVQGIGELSLDSSKRLRDNLSNVLSSYDKSSRNNPGASYQEPPKEQRKSSSEEEDERKS